jgi:hypothetical protein
MGKGGFMPCPSFLAILMGTLRFAHSTKNSIFSIDGRISCGILATWYITVEGGGFVERRIAQRYDAGLLQEDLSKVLLVFPDKHETEAHVIDITSQGFRVSIPPEGIPTAMPHDNETVELFVEAIYLRVMCRCVHSMTDHNGNLVVGYYVFDPDDQVKLRMILDKID